MHTKVFTGLHCEMTISRPDAGVALIVYRGSDIGEFGDAPFQELARNIDLESPVEIFVDAREVSAASLDVSGAWAQWMNVNRDRIHRLNILCGSRFIELTASFVQRFTQFGSRMRIYTEAVAFDEALRVAGGQAHKTGIAVAGKQRG